METREDIEVAAKLLLGLTDAELLAYCPAPESAIRTKIVPHPRQAEFLALDCEEAMFGGAVGGGKTEMLLEWLREGAGYDNFSGLFLRRTFAQLKGSPTSPIERSFKFFRSAGGTFNATEKVWHFPNGAMIRFGHMQHENDKHNYDGPEFHRIVFDQVEQFSETQYEYMFSRLRRTVGFPLSCGIRSAANPIGGNWVKQRFVTQEAMDSLAGYTAYDPSPAGMRFTSPCGAVFVPSRIADNPSLQVEEYIERLRSKLGAVLAAKLANGDWSAVEGAVVDADNLRYYQTQGKILRPLIELRAKIGKNEDELRRFATIDTAGTSKQKAAEKRGKPASWSVCAIWDHWPEVGLFLRHVWRARVGWPDLRDEVKGVLVKWGNPRALIENAHHGQVLAAEISNSQLVPTTMPGMKKIQLGDIDSAKYDRAVASGLLAMIDEGKFYLPDASSVEGASGWLPEFESELLGWTGHPDEPADQVDVCSYAANQVNSTSRESWGGVVNPGHIMQPVFPR